MRFDILARCSVPLVFFLRDLTSLTVYDFSTVVTGSRVVLAVWPVYWAARSFVVPLSAVWCSFGARIWFSQLRSPMCMQAADGGALSGGSALWLDLVLSLLFGALVRCCGLDVRMATKWSLTG